MSTQPRLRIEDLTCTLMPATRESKTTIAHAFGQESNSYLTS